MAKVYRIRNWANFFENHESKKLKNLTWIPMPNKHDGRGFRRVAALPNSVQVFCGWSLIVQVASKMPTRGALLDEDGALTPADLALKTGFPERIFADAFTALIRPEIRWLELVEVEISGEPPDTPGDDSGEWKGREWKTGTEGKTGTGMLEPGNLSFAERPSLQEVLFEAERIGLAAWKAEDFFNEMEGCGWLDFDHRPVAKWRPMLARVRTKWEADGRPTGPLPNPRANGAAAPLWQQIKALEQVVEDKRKALPGISEAHHYDKPETYQRALERRNSATAELKELRSKLAGLRERVAKGQS